MNTNTNTNKHDAAAQRADEAQAKDAMQAAPLKALTIASRRTVPKVMDGYTMDLRCA